MRHIADVQQAVDAAQIDKRAVLGEILHDAGDHRAFGRCSSAVCLRDCRFFFQRRLARDHHVAAAAVQLHDLDGNILADELVQIVNRARCRSANPA